MSCPAYEITTSSKSGNKALEMFGCAGGYQFMVRLDGRIIGLSKFKFKNAELAATAGMHWSDCFFDVR